MVYPELKEVSFWAASHRKGHYREPTPQPPNPPLPQPASPPSRYDMGTKKKHKKKTLTLDMLKLV